MATESVVSAEDFCEDNAKGKSSAEMAHKKTSE
jgi:hypothetical protein